MLKTLAYATLFSTALAGSAAFAQQSPGGAANPAAPMKQEPMKQDQAKPGQTSMQGAQSDNSQARRDQYPGAIWHKLRDDATRNAVARAEAYRRRGFRPGRQADGEDRRHIDGP